jgi:hypothetical protein
MTRQTTIPRIVLLLSGFCFLCLGSAPGCGSRTNESFVPRNNLARTSLERALKSWQERMPAGAIEPAAKGQPTIQVAESDWAAGHQLSGYEISAELPREGNTCRFQVRLTITGAAAPVEATYHVFGKDPIWVSRDKDYAQMESM